MTVAKQIKGKMYNMFSQGITPEPVDGLVVHKLKASGRNCVQSTLYKAYRANCIHQILIKIHLYIRWQQIYWEMNVLFQGLCLAGAATLISLRPPPLVAKIIDGTSAITMVSSKFGDVQKGSLLSYQRPAGYPSKYSKMPPLTCPTVHLAWLRSSAPMGKDTGGASHIVEGQIKLHTYHWQVQGQLMVTGLAWCYY